MLQPFDVEPAQSWDASYPWNRQPCDNDESWRLFRGWLQLGPVRDLFVYGKRIGRDLESIAHEGFWLDRAKAYDSYIHEQYNATVVEHVIVHAKDTAEKHLRIIDDALDIASIEFHRLLNETKERTMSGTMKPRDLITLLDRCIKLRLLLAGEATERIEIKDIEEVLHALPFEQIEALQQLQGKLLCGK